MKSINANKRSIYAHTDNELYVNLFIPSRLNWKEKKTEIIQKNSFPDEAKTQLIINPEKTAAFTLKLRYPAWVKKWGLKVSVNGKDYPVSQDPASYISIDRKWKKGDKVVMEMPMRITVEQLPDKSNYYSIFYGPVTLAAKTGTEDMTGLFADDSRGGHIAHGRQIPMKDMPIIVSDRSTKISRVLFIQLFLYLLQHPRNSCLKKKNKWHHTWEYRLCIAMLLVVC